MTAAAAAAFSTRAKATTEKAPRRVVLTTGFWSSRMDAVDIDQTTTVMLTMPLEAPTLAIRIGLANDTPVPYSLGGVCCCEANGWEPPADVSWSYFTFGRQSQNRGQPDREPQPFVVSGNRVWQTGASNVPFITWSDWMDFRTRSAGQPQLLFRAVLPAQTMPMIVVGFPPDTAKVVPTLPSRVVQARQMPGDLVNTPATPLRNLKNTAHVPIYAIQYRTVSPGLQIVVGGDSQLAAWDTFAQQAAMRLSTPTLPISVWDVAQAAGSKTFWPIQDLAIDAASPSVCVLQGWTANDGETVAAYERFLPDVLETVQRVRRQGGIPIVVKGTPRKLFGTPALAGWEEWNASLERLVPGVTLFDVNPSAADPERPGDWRADMTTDRVHPNDAGNAAIAVAFERLLRSLI